MILHARTHPHLDEPGCFGCKLAGVRVSATAMPTRRPGFERSNHIDAVERQWDKDMPAYKRLVRQGYQPKNIDGCHVLEQHAETRTQIEHGIGSPPDLAQRKGYIE